MLKKTKIRLISIFATAFAALSIFAIGFGQTANRVYAQSGKIFEMENGASLKISEDGGIRFRVKMDEEQMLYVTQSDDVSLHFLVAPHEFYNAVPYANGTFDYYNGLSKKKVINVDESKIYEEDGYYWANGCVTNINVANRYLDYTFLAYTYDAQTNVTDYAGVNIGGEVIQETHALDYKLGNVRGNLVDLLSQAVVYDNENVNYTDSVFNCSAYADWFGAEKYPIQINNLEMYNSLVNKVNGGEDFSAYNISVLDTVSMDGRTELSEGKTLDTNTSYMVKFLNDDNTLYKKYILNAGETLKTPKAPVKASTAQYSYTFLGWDCNGDGIVDDVETNVTGSVTYKAVYQSAINQYTITFDAEGGLDVAPVTVEYGTSLSTFCTQKYVTADSGFYFDSWLYNGEKIDPNGIVEGDMTLTAFYRRVDGLSVDEAPVNGDFYEAFLEIPVDAEVGTTVMIEMDIFVTGKIVSSGVDTSSEYYNQWATSSIRWVDSVYETDGENTEGRVNAKPVVVSFDRMHESQGEWMRICFFAEVRNFPVLRDGTGWAGVEMSGANAVYLFAYKFKSAASFNYRNVVVSTDVADMGKAMPAGTKKVSGNINEYRQAFAAIPTDYAEGTPVMVEMDVYVTGTYNQYTNGIYLADVVYAGSDIVNCEAGKATKLVSYATMTENEGKWITLTFETTVKNYTTLRSGVEYASIDVSQYGNAVYLFANGFTSEESFNYKNVSVVGKMPDGTKKVSGTINAHHQAFVGLSTDYAEGTKVEVSMDVYVTGTYNQYTSGIYLADVLYADTDIVNCEAGKATKLVSYATMTENVGKWITLTFETTVKNYTTLRSGTEYASIDVSQYGNAVYLFANGFTSADSFIFRNVEMTAVQDVPNGEKKSNGYYQAFVGLPVDVEVGTKVNVSMDIYVTGTVDSQYKATNIRWVDTLYSNNAPESSPTIIDNATLQQIAGQWYHVEFEATVRNFSSLRGDANFAEMDVSAYGNAIYIMAYQFKSAASFTYKNVEISLPVTPTEPVIDYETTPDGTYKTGTSSGYTQAFVGLPTDYAAGTYVKVDMEIYVTGTYDKWTNGIKWVNALDSAGWISNSSQILTYDQLNEGAGKWIPVSFYAYVRDFDEICLNTSYSLVDVSSYGNAVFLVAHSFTSLQTFNYRNVVITDRVKIVGEVVPTGTYKTGASSGYAQAAIGLETDLPEGTFVSVEMDIFVTGTYDEYTYIKWVNTVYSNGGRFDAPTILNYDMMAANVGQWITVKFDAYVRNFTGLCIDGGYTAMDVSQYGNAVYILAENFKDPSNTFRYKNVSVTAYDVTPNGEAKANGYYQAFVGLPVDVEVGTNVNVSMDIYVTGTVDSQYKATNIRWVDTLYSNNAPELSPTIIDNATLQQIAGQWYHVEFEAIVRNFSSLRGDANFAEMDVSAYGNAIYIMAYQFKSAESFLYRNVEITVNGENVYNDGTYAPETYISNGEEIEKYTIVVADNANKATQYAATILQARLRQVIGVDVAVVTDATAETELEILLGNTNRTACLGIDFAALGEESYRVKTVGNDLVIAGNDRGVLYGVYAYLEALGYRFYTVDVEKLPSEVFVPVSMDLAWDPTFGYREVMYEMTWDAEWAVSQRINSDFIRSELKNDSRYGGFTGYVGGDSWTVHTLSKLLPESELSVHPEYFALVNGKRIAKTSEGLYTQPCLTNEDAYQYVLNSALNKIASDRKANIISISENDSGTYCNCDACNASYAQYGVSGTFFRFINRIAGDIAKVYPDVWVDTLSYDMSKDVPENLTLEDNVIVRVCLRMCNFCTDPSKCEQLAEDQQRLRSFAAICDNVYVWMYPINWGNLYAALPNYEELRYHVNFFAEVGVKGIYAEGYSRENPEFGELKAYLMAKLLQNPTMSKAEYEYHYNDFLQGYYGEAAEYIAKYHQITKKMMNAKMKNAHYDKYFTAADNFDFAWDSTTHTYDMTNINKINALWAEALKSVKVGSAEWHHVKKSMIHWTYIELYNTMDNRYKYGTDQEKAELVARNEALYNDIVYYGTIRIYDNSHDLQEITDFTESPHKDKGNWFDQRTTFEETLGGLLGGLV